LQKALWKATVNLLLNDIPQDYCSHVVQYGEIEDEFDNAEEAWKKTLLAHYDYDPKVIAEFESTAA
jgi:hypothetical protein